MCIVLYNEKYGYFESMYTSSEKYVVMGKVLEGI